MQSIGYEHSYFTEPSAYLKWVCAYCRSVANQPHQLRPCQDVYCKSCLHVVMQRQTLHNTFCCWLCDEEVNSSQIQDLAEVGDREIGKLQAKCPDCQSHMTFSQLLQHAPLEHGRTISQVDSKLSDLTQSWSQLERMLKSMTMNMRPNASHVSAMYKSPVVSPRKTFNLGSGKRSRIDSSMTPAVQSKKARVLVQAEFPPEPNAMLEKHLRTWTQRQIDEWKKLEEQHQGQRPEQEQEIQSTPVEPFLPPEARYQPRMLFTQHNMAATPLPSTTSLVSPSEQGHCGLSLLLQAAENGRSGHSLGVLI